MPLHIYCSLPANDNYCHTGWQSLKTDPVLPTHMHVTEKVIHYTDCVVAKVWFGFECLWVSRIRYVLVQNCVTQDGVWTRLFYAYIFQNHEKLLTFLHEGGLLKSVNNCSKCNNMRSWRYKSKTDSITGSAENEETIMYKHKSLNYHSPPIKVTMLKQSYLMPTKNNIRYKNTSWLDLILQSSFTGLYKVYIIKITTGSKLRKIKYHKNKHV
jgi:hypothetical protein